ncbi:DUF1659 domain-containing protein [Sedimentibacter sp.]|uniref:DUF1659 domain-containing protein n=1 Tax=Sedimentibacter sp. TaxID=1960295 RepID=UPI0028B07BFB|nr:DUF1659 domain-containing protein [Sedimentibacter sp.]
MPIIKLHKNSKVRIVLDAGLDDNDKKLTKYKTLDKARYEAGDQALFDIAKNIALLQKHSVRDIIKHEEYTLIEE